jgi:hypothetical protein
MRLIRDLTRTLPEDYWPIISIVVVLSDNLYSRWRRTCTSHVHGVVLRQYLHRALGAPGQSIIKIINKSTHFINELPYTNFVTVMSPVRRLKKLFSYYSIIWRNSTSSSDSDTSSTGRRPWSKSYLNRHRTRFHEIPRDSTRLHLNRQRTILTTRTILMTRTILITRTILTTKIPSQFLLYLLVKWLHHRVY